MRFPGCEISRRGRAGRGLFLAAAALLALAGAGCFYTVRTSVPGHIKTIAIPVFRNQTLQPTLENDLTQVVIDRFQRDNHLTLAEPGGADALLEGTLVAYENRVYRFDDKAQAQEYIVTVTLDAVVKDQVKNKDLWSQQGIRASATYLLGGAQARTEADARKEAVQQLADILLSRTVEGW
jgi:hypothetical protein